MSTCVTCGAEIENSAFTGVLCEPCHAKDEAEHATPKSWWSKLPGPLIVALLPFVVSYRETSSTVVEIDGRTTAMTQSSIDYVAIVLGPLAVVLGLLALKNALGGPAEEKNEKLALAMAAVLLGAYQAYRSVIG